MKAEELAGPKILGKIEIGKKKTAEAPVAKTEAPAKDVITEPIVEKKSKEEVTAIETPVKPAVVEKTSSPTTELPVVSEAIDADEEEVEKIDTKFETLSGPKVLGKINRYLRQTIFNPPHTYQSLLVRSQRKRKC